MIEQYPSPTAFLFYMMNRIRKAELSTR